ncbi:phage tail assembly chaperone G [Planococcus sp. FY231025]|uniref:phage tail assembly chaperone G n=1 Tax=Planococcus sp. FY231025 TaxID=3455699 RepID=UPI003F8F96B0
MRKLVIRLYVDGKVRKYTAPRYVSWNTFDETMALQKVFNSNISNQELILKCFYLVCSIFGHQFTVEQLQKGYDIKEILKKTSEALDYVISTADISRKGEVIPFENRSKRSAKANFERS